VAGIVTYSQRFYQNTDLTIAYELIEDDTGLVVGYGGNISQDSVLLESQEEIDAAKAELDSAVAASKANNQAAVDAEIAAAYAARVEAAQALVDAQILTTEQAEALYNVELP